MYVYAILIKNCMICRWFLINNCVYVKCHRFLFICLPFRHRNSEAAHFCFREEKFFDTASSYLFSYWSLVAICIFHLLFFLILKYQQDSDLKRFHNVRCIHLFLIFDNHKLLRTVFSPTIKNFEFVIVCPVASVIYLFTYHWMFFFRKWWVIKRI